MESLRKQNTTISRYLRKPNLMNPKILLDAVLVTETKLDESQNRTSYRSILRKQI